jgi:hypothetical protein
MAARARYPTSYRDSSAANPQHRGKSLREIEMVGYHFTTWRNWEGIQECGLKLYPFPRHLKDLRDQTIKWGFDDAIIFLWLEIPKGFDLVGSVIDRVCAKQTGHLVLLEVGYELAEMIVPPLPINEPWYTPGDTYLLKHQGAMNHDSHDSPARNFHDKEIVLLKKPIDRSRVHLVAEFDLEKLLESCFIGVVQ